MSSSQYVRFTTLDRIDSGNSASYRWIQIGKLRIFEISAVQYSERSWIGALLRGPVCVYVMDFNLLFHFHPGVMMHLISLFLIL